MPQKIWINFSFLVLILLQMSYPLLKDDSLRVVTILTVIAGALFAYVDASINFGARFANILALVTVSFSFTLEAIGQATTWPFGSYKYSSTLGVSLLEVPIIVPLAWLMMSYPVLIVARKVSPNWTFLFGGFGLMAWDLFLDPQMVKDGRWKWEFTGAHVPFQNEIPLSNAVGWLFSGMILMALLNVVLPKERRKKQNRTKHVEVFLIWTLLSGVIGNLVFFDMPGVALTGGIAFSIFLIPYFYKTILGSAETN